MAGWKPGRYIHEDVDIGMDVIELATQVLATGVRYGRSGIEKAFGTSINPAIEEAFAELHKNNLPEESLVFLLKRLFTRQSDSGDAVQIISPDNQIGSLLNEIRSLDEYRRNDAVAGLSDFQQQSVLKDFIICLAQALRGKIDANN